MDAATWGQIGRIREWLDSATPEDLGEENLWMRRVLKIGEEFGETSEALLGVIGANPRKGYSHTWDDVRKELVDVAVTALIALATVAPNGEEVFDEGLRRLVARIPQEPGTTG